MQVVLQVLGLGSKARGRAAVWLCQSVEATLYPDAPQNGGNREFL